MKFLLIFGAVFLVTAMAKDHIIKVSGRICCMSSGKGPREALLPNFHPDFEILSQNAEREKRETRKLCVAPKQAKVELWDHWTFLPDTSHYVHEFHQTSDYSFEWGHDKVISMDPLLKIHVECSDGRIHDEIYEHYDETIIVQNVNV